MQKRSARRLIGGEQWSLSVPAEDQRLWTWSRWWHWRVFGVSAVGAAAIACYGWTLFELRCLRATPVPVPSMAFALLRTEPAASGAAAVDY